MGKKSLGPLFGLLSFALLVYLMVTFGPTIRGHQGSVQENQIARGEEIGREEVNGREIVLGSIPSGFIVPTIYDYAAKTLAKDSPDEHRVPLMRPYALVCLGCRIIDMIDFTSPPAKSATDIRTLIIVKEQEIGNASYGTPDSLTGYVPHANTYTRYGYFMWAFDLKTGTLQAYKSLQDPDFKPEYKDFETPKHIDASAVYEWAQSVTDEPLVGGQHQ